MVTYEWNETKAASNELKHGVGFSESSSVFDDPLSVSIPDPEHSTEEERWMTVGVSAMGRLLVVVHTRSYLDSSNEVIRLISAGRGTSRESRVYTEG
jgi:uncharacterized protein